MILFYLKLDVIVIPTIQFFLLERIRIDVAIAVVKVRKFFVKN